MDFIMAASSLFLPITSLFLSSPESFLWFLSDVFGSSILLFLAWGGVGTELLWGENIYVNERSFVTAAFLSCIGVFYFKAIS